jgi:hypothetical protein
MKSLVSRLLHHARCLAPLVLACAFPASSPAAPATPPALDLPAIGMGLDGGSYYAPYSPYTDAVKQMRWIDVASWNERGFPASAKDGRTATGRVAVESGNKWPSGDYVLTWEGAGDLLLNQPEAQIVSEDLSGPVKRRVYRATPAKYGLELRVASFPVDRVRLLLPGLEKHPSLWNPAFLAYIRPFTPGPLRFMDMNGTNGSKQVDWADRTPRDWSTYVNANHPESSAPWPVRGRVAYEAMIELCNELDADMWLCIPHQATDDYVAKLAALLKTGIDPATGQKTTEPLKRRVWLEYSNEVWNWNFEQSNWVNEKLAALGADIDERYARQAVKLYDIFRRSFADDARVIRVIGTQTGMGNGKRTRDRLRAVPRESYEVLAITTYYSFGIQQWIHDNPQATVEQALDELERRMGSGPFDGPDGADGQREEAYIPPHYKIAAELKVPVVAYEGGDHINPVGRIQPAGGGKKVPLSTVRPEATAFIHAMIRHPRQADLYKHWLSRHQQSGLRMHMPFVLMAGWSRYGQWGHIEHIGQPLAEATKYRALIEHYKLTPPATK